jgi:hypothetical protein
MPTTQIYCLTGAIISETHISNIIYKTTIDESSTNPPFTRFPIGFNKRAREKHSELLEYIVEELGVFMAPDWLGRGVTLNDLWHLNKTLIVRQDCVIS